MNRKAMQSKVGLVGYGREGEKQEAEVGEGRSGLKGETEAVSLGERHKGSLILVLFYNINNCL